MALVLWSWGISAAVLVVAAALIGLSVKKNILGILIDSRGRYSLSQLQMMLWTILVLSLFTGVFITRLVKLEEPSHALDIQIPSEILIVMGISVGSGATAMAIKAAKDLKKVNILDQNNPKFSQVFTREEGSGPEVIDITKFQNFWLTLIIVTAYIATAIAHVSGIDDISNLNSLPGFSDSWLILLGISHSGYIAGKLPDQP